MRFSSFVFRSAAVFPFLAVLLVSLLTTRESRAETTLAVDAEVSAPVATRGNVSTGVGIGARLGHRFHVPLLVLTPEIGGDYHGFGGDPASVNAVRAFAGGRLGIGEVVRPGVYAHIAYGHVSASTGDISTSFNGLSYDLGGFLDLTVLPLVDLGIHAGYTNIANSDEPGNGLRFIDVGAHVAFVF